MSDEQTEEAVEYKAVARFKLGPDEDGNDQGYLERGEVIDVELTEEQIDNLLAGGSILSSEDFDAQFPDFEEGTNDAFGTPSNLQQIEGTELEAPDQTGDGDDEDDQSNDDTDPIEGNDE